MKISSVWKHLKKKKRKKGWQENKRKNYSLVTYVWHVKYIKCVLSFILEKNTKQCICTQPQSFLGVLEGLRTNPFHYYTFLEVLIQKMVLYYFRCMLHGWFLEVSMYVYYTMYDVNVQLGYRNKQTIVIHQLYCLLLYPASFLCQEKIATVEKKKSWAESKSIFM